jgi:DNA-binding transcriptional regulator LsrR (DeoR family)
MHPSQRFKNNRVIQILGGVGSPNAEVHATQVTRRLADLIGGEATLLPAPGVVGSRSARDVLLKDRFVREALDLFPRVTLALVGIGATEPSRGLASSGNIFSPQEIRLLASKGAVGDICLRFFDAAGRQVVTELNDRVISMDLAQLGAVGRIVGVAGGYRKTQAIRGALAGRLINVLITDLASAERLLVGPPIEVQSAAAAASAPRGRKTRNPR